MKILIIDDQPLLTEKLINSIADNNSEIVVARNGKLGLKEFYTAHNLNAIFDFIFLDLDMPVLRGEDVLKAIRNYEDCMEINNAKVIIISANCDSSKTLELFNLGCNYYVSKPFTKQELREAMAFVLRSCEESSVLN